MNQEKFKNLANEEREYIREKEKITYKYNLHKLNSNTDKVNKICLWSDEHTFDKIMGILSKEKIQLSQCFNFDARNYYEIIQRDCDKGDAIKELCNYLSVPIEKTMAFGDGRNDIDMLKKVGTAVGMRNGNKEIFKYVDSICEEPFSDGIYLELKKRNVI